MLPDDDSFKKAFVKFDQSCTECHTYRDPSGEGNKGPDLAGYGDAEWLRLMIMNPASPLRYGNKNRMPAFRPLDGPGTEVTKELFERPKREALKALGEPPEAGPEKKQFDEKKKEIETIHRVLDLSDIERELIIRWMLKDFRVVFGGETISGPPKK